MNTSSSPVSYVPSNDFTNISSESLIRCSQCSQPRFFKGQRGLKMHVNRIHHSITNNVQVINQAPSTSPPIPISEPFHKNNIKGAARILFSNDLIAPSSPDTLSALKSKHPLNLAINSFSSGSAGGMYGLTSQHLKGIVSVSCGEAGNALLKDLVSLVNLVLSGGVNPEFLKFLYGANICAFKKKDGGIRAIAVGCPFRRLAAKICCRTISDSLATYFGPVQLGFGIKGWCEAAILLHRTFLPTILMIFC
ncbi:hypothetical protein ABMA27_010354 [Loxostege sticticalis]|uniref:Uncharacterized protein n=1 Tax=Loxostege sticticalis TaxID=481309 RepID=A0ABR3H5S7_LOXSC